MSSPRAELWAGVRSTLPLLAGDLPYGLIYGVLAAAAGLPPLLTIAMSSILFAVSAQIIAVGQLGAVPRVPHPIVVLTTLVVNLRHLLYSASLGPYLRRLSRGWKWLLAYLVTDEAYAVTIGHFQEPGEGTDRHWHLLGA